MSGKTVVPEEAVEAAAENRWWEPHARACDVFRAPHADCDCGEDPQ